MSTPVEDLSQRERELGEVIFACLQAQEAGQPLDPADVLAHHPKYLTELAEFFAGRSRVERLAAPLREAVLAVSTTAPAPGAANSLPDLLLPASGSSFGDYELLGELGRGGMGVVYRARQKSLNRVVALKMICRNDQSDPRERERFRAEAELAATLDHPGIVPIYEVGEYQPGGAGAPLPYFTMKLIEGGSLAERLQSEPRPSGSGGPDRSLTVAALTATLADAVHHAHQRGILHRDLKPANVLLDASGQPHLTDFGLAKRLPREGDTPATPVTQSGALVGTPSYMAPEQTTGRRGAVTTATDVYGLGAILYALLTGRPPHQGSDPLDTLLAVREREPEPPSRVRSGVPRDLETICLKALAKEPARRYGSAAELAADLRRWLAGEPIQARPAGRAEKVLRWCRRNPGMAGLAAAVLLLMVGVTVSSGWAALAARGREEAERLRAEDAVEREEEAQRLARDREREILIQQIQSLRLTTPRKDGWRRKAWDLVRQAAEIRKDPRLRNQATALLQGLDAIPVKEFKFGSSALAFDADGKRLLMGGLSDKDGKPSQTTSLWDGGLDEHDTGRRGGGPVAFREDAPLQLVIDPKDRLTLQLWDLASRKQFQRLSLRPDGPPEPPTIRNLPTLALSGDGNLAASSAELADGKGVGMVWDTRTGATVRRLEQRFTALAFRPDCKELATGDAKGQVMLWPLPGGEPTRLRPTNRMQILCLAYGRDPRKDGDKDFDQVRWQLAVGHNGGPVTVWDLHRQIPRGFFHDPSPNVNAVAFGPDGTLLASAGRNHAWLWDVGSGRPLLNLLSGNWMTGVVFSPDGGRLAVSTRSAFGEPESVKVWGLQPGRGMRTLYGLASSVAQVRFSADSRFLAAIGQEWQVGTWDLATGHLRHLLDVPEGYDTGNAALALDSDGTRLAFCAGREAGMWEVATGKKLASWPLPPALNNRMAFDSSGRKLFLFRVETRSRRSPPHHTRRDEDPRVARFRDLLGTTPTREYDAQVDGFNTVYTGYDPSQDGRYFLIAGVRGTNDEECTFKLLDSSTAREVWEYTGKSPPLGVTLDPLGKTLVLTTDQDEKLANTLVEVPTGKLRGRLHDGWGLSALGPDGRHYVMTGTPAPHQFSLYRQGANAALLVLDTDKYVASVRFSDAGNLLAYGNDDGTVTVCDLQTMERHLSEIGLGW